MVFFRYFILTFFTILHLSSLAQSTPAADRIQFYRTRISTYLDKENALESYYLIDEKGIKIFASPNHKQKNIPEFVLAWNELDVFKKLVHDQTTDELLKIMTKKKDQSFSAELLSKTEPTSILPISFNSDPTKPLQGIKVAIDPGHIAGNMEMARIERKFIDIQMGTANSNKNIQLIEGDLTLATAKLLKVELEKSGAIVMLTRDKVNTTSFDLTYDQWLSKNFKPAIDSLVRIGKLSNEKRNFLVKASKKEIFNSFFKDYELKERARKMNAFHPDLSVIIHYNVNEKNTGWKKTTEKNFNMAFVPGSFMKGELKEPEDRLEFLRLMITDDLDGSIGFSQCVIESFEKRLNVSAANESDADYLKENCLVTRAKGTFARNLFLTRMVHGTLVYGETLYQDHSIESQLLGEKQITIGEISTSIRVKQVAGAYYEAILNYVQNKK